MLKNTYKGKKILLTGHTGFKGGWMTFVLNFLGAEVYGFSQENDYSLNFFDLLQLRNACNHKIGDIRDFNLINEYVQEVQPDFIFHLAAQSLVRKSYKEPLLTFEVNTQGTANVLEALRNLKKTCQCICITTDKVYENLEENRAFVETDTLGGYDPYSSSKAAAELVISSYRNSFFSTENYQIHQKSVASVRAGNVIGGGDRCEDRLIPDLIKSIEKNQKLILRNPTAIRPWQHVLEPVFGYLLLGEKMLTHPEKYSQAFNFGPNENDAANVEEIVKSAIKTMGKGTYEIKRDENQPHEAHYLRLNINKAKDYLNWEPIFNMEEAIQHTMTWYAATDKYKITMEQTKNFMERFDTKIYH